MDVQLKRGLLYLKKKCPRKIALIVLLITLSIYLSLVLLMLKKTIKSQNKMIQYLTTETTILENRLREQSNNKTHNPRFFHKCLNEKIPYITPVLETAQHLLYTNASLARIGDVELQLMMNKSFWKQEASSELSDKLLTILRSNDPTLMIGLQDFYSGCPQIAEGYAISWNNQTSFRNFVLTHAPLDKQYFATLISSPYATNTWTHCILFDQFYQTLRQVWKDKDLVILRGDNKQEYQYDIFDTAHHQSIYYAPRYQAWSAYKELKEKLMKENADQLFILSIGPTATVLTYDLHQAGRRAFDLGHLSKDYNDYMHKIVSKDFWTD